MYSCLFIYKCRPLLFANIEIAFKTKKKFNLDNKVNIKLLQNKTLAYVLTAIIEIF